MAVDVGAPAFDPKVPDVKNLHMDHLRFVSERATDTMFVDFSVQVRPASSVPLDIGDRGDSFVRVDPKTDEIVGLQIEDFLAYAVEQNPAFAELLGFAEWRGVGESEADALRRRARNPADPRSFLAALRSSA